ncbi:MAG TPA: nuclear transport factor 2 family protein [Rhodopila sp.]|nr:nuclear transport factor 2 family protein [Rhodopila sp.]
MIRRTLTACLVAALVSWAPALAQQGPAQQGPAISDQAAQDAAVTISRQFGTNYNAGNAAGVASLFADQTEYFTPAGKVLRNRRDIEAAIADRIKAGWTKEEGILSEAHAAGNMVWLTGRYSLIGSGKNEGKRIGGHFAGLLIQEGQNWRFRMLIANLTPTRDMTGMGAAGGLERDNAAGSRWP